MPYMGAMRVQAYRFMTALVIGLVLAGGIAQRADAQTFEFTPTGAFTSGVTTFSTLTITANPTSNLLFGNANLAQYNITGISGTFAGNAITGLLAPGTNVGGRSVPNAFVSNAAGLTGTILAARDDANSVLAHGIGFTTSAASFLICNTVSGFECSPNAANFSSTLQVYSSGPIPGVGGFTSAVAVPGPLAGAGMLSWLAVMLMGLAWRRQWLLAKVRVWLAAVKQGDVKAA